MLYKIFSYCFENNVFPDNLKSSIILPIKKPAREILLDTVVFHYYQYLARSMQTYWYNLFSKWLEDNDVLVDEQNGFDKKRSTHVRIPYST